FVVIYTRTYSETVVISRIISAIMVFGTRQPMNELKLVLLGLVVLVFSVVLLRIFEAPEIIEDKEVEIASALGIGLV
ncbi:MAG TPA: hypothetical protein VGW09_07900, partial [Nitrososphaeraceae archaeon]|nr:hypothetical protein [Nitrososphaeraceae archaeon]